MSEGLIRLNRYLASTGIGSRRECDTLIEKRLVSVNGKIVDELGVKVDPARDVICFSGNVVKPAAQKIYIAYHKQPGTVVTADDPEGRPTVYDELVKKGVDITALKYVGRLDMFSEGLLLFTNDGDLVHALTHPRFHIKKVYEVKTDKPITPTDIEKLTGPGVESEGQILHAGSVRQLETPAGFTEIVLYEGKNRQIRRMLEVLGYKVLRLVRTQFSSVKLRDLPAGEVRSLSEREVASLASRGY